METGLAPIVLVGAGRMGGAMLEGWLKAGLSTSRVVVVDPQPPASVTEREIRVADTVGDIEGWAGSIVLAVKPQVMEQVLPHLSGLARENTVVVSVAAGTSIATLAGVLPDGQPIVRAMPNTPAQIGKGMTVLVANRATTDDQRAGVEALLATSGRTAWIEDEALMDAVTAVSGSGPAYVFLLAECMAEAGERAGLPPELAQDLARQTIVGAGALLGEVDLPAKTLRENVTSPGGTTQAALDVLSRKGGLPDLMGEAVEAARARSVALGG